jgi:hypothetical protein
VVGRQPQLDDAQQPLDRDGQRRERGQRRADADRQPHLGHGVRFRVDLQLRRLQLHRRVRRGPDRAAVHPGVLAGVLGALQRVAARGGHHGIPADDQQRVQRAFGQPVQHELPLQHRHGQRRRGRRGHHGVEPGRHVAHVRDGLDQLDQRGLLPRRQRGQLLHRVVGGADGVDVHDPGLRRRRLARDAEHHPVARRVHRPDEGRLRPRLPAGPSTVAGRSPRPGTGRWARPSTRTRRPSSARSARRRRPRSRWGRGR